MIKTKLFFMIIIIISTLINGGCGALLPSVKQTTKSPWLNFEDAKKAFDKITSNQTTQEDLKQLGFDPFETPNVKLVTYLELIERFLPNQSIRLEDIDQGVRSCLQVREHCQGYEVSPKMLNSRRYGNAFLDLLNFRRKKVTTGWRFNALIVLKEGLVVHKVWGGEPKVSEFEDKKNPLGPLQNIDTILPPIKIR
jgi:hypothetical protein